ncbi:hypothetical protein CALCODRAFT_81138 [Calocera cornea HHB12733]|uniref:Uncharacterized protein n=1 Tax=Calocera cornea HHB12733 TaxID=1353952 RepID=A0A165DEK3_9BASI|nr:hypothetical protein CALCODRAFT_81138 [Calocera cornea HHB12733]
MYVKRRLLRLLRLFRLLLPEWLPGFTVRLLGWCIGRISAASYSLVSLGGRKLGSSRSRRWAFPAWNRIAGGLSFGRRGDWLWSAMRSWSSMRRWSTLRCLRCWSTRGSGFRGRCLKKAV